MELILLIIIFFLLLANLCTVLLKNNRKQTEQLERLFRQESRQPASSLPRSGHWAPNLGPKYELMYAL